MYLNLFFRSSCTSKVISSNLCCAYLRRFYSEKADGERISVESRSIKVFNSLTKQKESVLVSPSRVIKWYSCGPTVYDSSHIGHASTYIRTDAIRRVLSQLGNLEVLFILGVTDIDDKIINRSKEMNVDHMSLCRKYEKEFFHDMTVLNVQPPTARMRVTEHVPQVIRFVQRLIDQRMAYQTSDGSIYYQVSSFPRYGQFGCSADAKEQSGNLDKKDPRDFVLWKASKPGEPFWPSPWGNGRPGWHIECSAMASEIFGAHMDIHSGGNDLIFPHHENELAQSEAYHSCDRWCSYWIHLGHLFQSGAQAKMSKSLKNTVSIGDMLQSYTPDEFRVFCFSMPYRSHLEYNKTTMRHAVNTVHALSSFVQRADAYVCGILPGGSLSEAHLLARLQQAKTDVETALLDDFDFPQSLRVISDLVHDANAELTASSSDNNAPRSPAVIAAISSYVQRITNLLGLELNKTRHIHTNSETTISEVMEYVLKFRTSVRLTAVDALKTAKPSTDERGSTLLAACDTLRRDLQTSGIHLKDMGKTSTWEMVDPPQQQRSLEDSVSK